MKNLFQGVGMLFIFSALIFLVIYSMVVTGSANEDFARDIFGLPIPHPPVWTSYIPFVGSLLGTVFEFFSLHGLVGMVIAIVLFSIGGFFMRLGGEKTEEIV